MKKILSAMVLASVLAGGAFAASITITAPQVTSLTTTATFTPTGGGGTASTSYTFSGTDLQNLNTTISSKFTAIQADLNKNFFSQMGGMPKLNQGFSNANMASFDNASLLGYQTYDLFAVMIGSNLALALPTLDPASGTTVLKTAVTQGDVYAGLATGGFAGQVGVNLSFLIPKLYASAKFGFVPSMPLNGISYQQGMFGLGVNYTLIPQYDLLAGLFKWRGVSVGSGFVFNGNSVEAKVPVDTTPQPFSQTLSSSATYNGFSGTMSTTISGNASADNTNVKLSITDSALVIPVDVMTSVQLLWFLNVGLGLGLDMNFSSSTVKIGASSDLNLKGDTSTKIIASSGSVAVNATATGGGDFFVPRLATSLGLDLAIFKLDVPISYYPTTQAFAIGVTGGIVW